VFLQSLTVGREFGFRAKVWLWGESLAVEPIIV